MFQKSYEKMAAFVVIGFTSVSGFSGVSQAKADSGTKSSQNGTVPVKTIGPPCASSDENNVCLAVKYVVYKDGEGQELLSAEEAVDNLKGINDVWAQCNIAFQIDKFAPVAPEDYGFNYDPAEETEISGIRGGLSDDSTLLLVTTGNWNRSGSLGNTYANAWTSLPGDFPFGVVLEQSVGSFPNIIAHEIGHYLNLLHVEDTGNVMNPVIYPESTTFDADQCELAKSTALTSWQKMLR